MLNVETYNRKSFPVTAVKVSAVNMEEAAKWCQGEVRSLKRRDATKTTPLKYVKVNMVHAQNERQTQAFSGDRILFDGKGYKVYTRKAFETSFEKAVADGTPAELLLKNIFSEPTGNTAEALF